MTDVHGNIDALQAAIDDIDGRAINHVYCLGDMISIGPFSNEVLGLLLAREDVTMLIGNHEEAILAVLDGRDPGSPGTERLHHQWIASRLDPAFAPILRALPRVLTVEHAGRRLLLLHYHLDENGLFAPYDREPSVEKLETIYAHTEADAVCFGHHHPVHFFRSATRVYVNPGSLGCASEPVARYAILSCGANGVEVELRSVPYDNRAFLESYRRLDVPAGEFILDLFHGRQHVSG